VGLMAVAQANDPQGIQALKRRPGGNATDRNFGVGALHLYSLAAPMQMARHQYIDGAFGHRAVPRPEAADESPRGEEELVRL
jgi:hypothetical protein